VVKPLDVFLRDYVRSPLKEKGFSKKGRDFRLTIPGGDVALINFLSWRMDFCEVEFILDAGILSPLHLEWQNEMRDLEGSSIANTLWWTRLKSPFAYRENQFLPTDTWAINFDDEERISFFLGELAALADHLRSLLDRRNLISMVRDPATAIQDLRPSRETALALLLVDAGPSPELEEILRALEAKNPTDDVASWVRSRLSSIRAE
jgi:hypothetical protein